MAIPVEMPKMSDTMVEGVLAAWLVEEGQKVTAGDVIAQVETDKATMDLEAYDDGVLLKRVVEAGGSVPIGGLIAVLGKEGEDASAILALNEAIAQYGGSGDGAPAAAPAPAPAAEAPPAPAPQASAPAPQAATAPAAAPAPVAAESAPAATDGGRAKASPLARSMAKEHGLELGALRGSGPEGRIVRRDVEAAVQQGSAAPQATAASASSSSSAPAAAPSGGTSRPNSQMRTASPSRSSPRRTST